jgi:cytochrome P450
MSDTQAFRYEDAPMAEDRTAGWNFLLDKGGVSQTADGNWYLTSTEAVRFAHRNPGIFSSAKAFESLGSPIPLIPLAVDRPEHKKYRKILDPMLAPRVVDTMEDDLRLQVRDLISQFAEKGECDIVYDLARLYPTQVFLTLVGMPLEDRDKFIEWEEQIVDNSLIAAGEEPRPEVYEAAAEIFAYLSVFIEKKRAEPGDDLISKILHLEGDDAWTDEEILGMCFLFILAGLDTVSAAIGFLFLHLARRPDLRHQLVDDSSLIPAFIEEILRLELPAPTTPRVTTEEVQLCGRTIPEGATVFICLATANRDPELFENPNDVSMQHTDRSHFSFGGGIHRCLGSHLARRELLLVVEEFLKQIPEFELRAGEKPEVQWPSGTLHLKSLPIVYPQKAAL